MDTDALRWFTMVAEGMTVTEVADLERMSQPGISRALTRLEKDVGAPLLHRQGRVLALTHAGAAFHRHSTEAIRHLADGQAAVQQQVDPGSGTVSIAFQASLGTWLVPDLVGSFRERHPRVRFDLRTKSDEHTVSVGSRSAIDVELSTLRAPDQPERNWQTLIREPIRLLIPQNHRLAGRRSASLAQVHTDPFVSLRQSSLLRTQLDHMCRRAGIEIDIAFGTDDLSTLRGHVAAGLGVAVIPARWDAGAAEPASALVHYLELEDPGSHREVGIAWSTQRRLLPAAELFRSFVISRAQRGELPSPIPV